MAKSKQRKLPQMSREESDRIASVKAAFYDAVNDLIAQDIADRSERMAAIHALTDAYFDSIGDMPEPAHLERLTDYILREELKDTDNHKIAHNEYPIMSDIQLDRRRFGRRGGESSNMAGETSLAVSKHYGVDGRDHRYPSRRTRTIDELIFVDEAAKQRNRSRNDQYRKDTSAGAVKTYNLRDTGGALSDEFTGCIKAAQKWREKLSGVYV